MDIDYSLRTMNGLRSYVKGKEVSGLKVKGVSDSASFDLPSMVVNEFIPNCVNEVAFPDMVRSVPHARRYAKFFSEVDEKSSVQLVIGRDSGNLVKTRCLGVEAPFPHQTLLGWGLVGVVWGTGKFSNVTALRTGLEHYEMVESIPAIKSDVLLRLPDDEMKGLSQDDVKFDAIMEAGTHVNDSGQIEMPLPFRDETQILPDNCKAVYCRTKNTLERLKTNKERLEKFCATIQAYIDAKHVEPVPKEEYNLHLG